jgi:hypothetical protein
MDETKGIRKEMIREINESPAARAGLESLYGQVWNTDELTRDFKVIGFASPFVIVERKSDRKKGSLTFQHDPRFYFEFQEA